MLRDMRVRLTTTCKGLDREALPIINLSGLLLLTTFRLLDMKHTNSQWSIDVDLCHVSLGFDLGASTYLNRKGGLDGREFSHGFVLQQ